MAPQQVTLTQLLLQGLTFSPQVLKKDQEAGSSTTTIQPDKVNDKHNELSGSRCSKGTWRRVFQVSGAIFSFSLMTKKLHHTMANQLYQKALQGGLKLSKYVKLLTLFESQGKSFRSGINQFFHRFSQIGL